MSYNNYFKNIDTIEKAYILGLVHKNNNIIINNSDTIINILSNLIPDIKKTLIINITDNEILEDIKNSINNFPYFNDNLKIAFVRGIIESNYNNIIEITDIIKPIINIIKKDFIIDYHMIDDNNILIKNSDKLNLKIYNNNDLTILQPAVVKHLLYKANYKPYIKVFKSHDDAVIPAKAFEEDAGYDLTIINKIKDFNSKTSLYDTGIKIEVEEGYYTEIVPRSSISKFGYILANNVGIIDNHYRGNLMIALTKIADDAPEIVFPFKCCQLIIRKQISANLYEIKDETLTTTLRNEGGFGSTS